MISEFRNLAEIRWKYMDDDDSKNGNIYSDKLMIHRNLLKEADKLIELESLLDDENEGVRFEAACALLQLGSEEAIKTLIEMTTRKGMIPFVAKQTLKHWKKI